MITELTATILLSAMCLLAADVAFIYEEHVSYSVIGLLVLAWLPVAAFILSIWS